MRTEIEAKLKIDSPDKIAKKLGELGAEFLEEQLQTDYYFDDANASLTKTDRCLRLRRQLVGQSEKMFLTYKGAKEKDKFKRRREIEVEINGDSAERLLLALGYEQSLAFEKKRRVWQLGECEVALDEVPLLGDFVEIEGPNYERIATVQRDLGLSDLPHIMESYAFLVEEKLRKLGKEHKRAKRNKSSGSNYEAK